MKWQPISTAPKDGTRIRGRVRYIERHTGKMRYVTRITWWGKTSHVPLYGWCHGRDVENHDLWMPEIWMPLPIPPQPEDDRHG